MNRAQKLMASLIVLAFATPLDAQENADDAPPTPTIGTTPAAEAAVKEITDTPRHAIAVLYPTLNSNVKGTVRFEATPQGAKVDANLRGLEPGPHGFHIHEFGDCSSTDGESAGAHFNPSNAKHGGPTDAVRHDGDLGNIIADNQGVARLQLSDVKIALAGPETIIGRAMVVHEKADDLKSDPSGNSGTRIACGVIGIANPEAKAAGESTSE